MKSFYISLVLIALVISGCASPPLLASEAATLPAAPPPTTALAACAYTQGYWKNHPAAWPVAELTLGDVAYSQEGVLIILLTPPEGQVSYMVAHQLIAAKLNLLNGAAGDDVAAVIAETEEWLVTHPLGSSLENRSRDKGIALAGRLDSFNNGLFDPAHCSETVLITPTVTLTATFAAPTLTPAPLPATPIPEEAAAVICTGTTPHPQGIEIAGRYGVAYEEIMTWFCAGFGFGEIDQAYGLGRQSGVSAAEILAMRTAGLGWKQIRKQVEAVSGAGQEVAQSDPH